MDSETPELVWIVVDKWGDTYKAKVPGGWLYRYNRQTMCFVPSPYMVEPNDSDE